MAGVLATGRELKHCYTFELASPDDDTGLRRLLRRNPLAGDVQVTFEREPDFFAGVSLMGTTHQTVVARTSEPRRIIGMGTRSIRDVYLDGGVQTAGYLSELRVDKAHRGHCSLLRKGFEMGRLLHGDGLADRYLTSIVSDNERARRFLEAGLPGMPTYTPQCTYHTLVIPTRRALVRSSRDCSSALAADRERIADCLHRNYRRYAWAPYWNADELGTSHRTPGLCIEDFLITSDGDRVTGCIALWDQRGFRQVVVRGYSDRFARWRRVMNLCSAFTGVPRLPPCGEPWAYAYVSPLAIDGDDPVLFVRLLKATMHRAWAHGYDYIVLGLADTHPLLPVAKRITRHRVYPSRLYIVTWDSRGSSPTHFPCGVPHPEIALL